MYTFRRDSVIIGIRNDIVNKHYQKMHNIRRLKALLVTIIIIISYLIVGA